tara:strand:+ start:1471 stop:1977 length:507 start_codon:yes stop_codon:yes gene_type:complete
VILNFILFFFWFGSLGSESIKLNFDTISIKKNISPYSNGLKFVPNVKESIKSLIKKSTVNKVNHLEVIIERYNVVIRKEKEKDSKIFNEKIKIFEHQVDLKINIFDNNRNLLFSKKTKFISMRIRNLDSRIQSQIRFNELLAEELCFKIKKDLRKFFLVHIGDYVTPN